MDTGNKAAGLADCSAVCLAADASSNSLRNLTVSECSARCSMQTVTAQPWMIFSRWC